ncbi:cilia- and flagella-associated protein 97 isoform X2 [Hoplias malabaricus]|uniref:cilia- and flagella-associated protein 97 isoform X2 n=1 Tax=Hoplias malabaricus TaxID=27720 RepID=UPI00346347D2
MEKVDVAMFSPKELEGEVDHSFFDSDTETGKTVQEPKEQEENPVKNPSGIKLLQKESTVEVVESDLREREAAVLKGERLEEGFSSLQIHSVETEKSEVNSVSTKEGRGDHSENAALKEGTEEESGTLESSHLPSSDRSEFRHSSQSESESCSEPSYSSAEPLSDSSAEEREEEMREGRPESPPSGTSKESAKIQNRSCSRSSSSSSERGSSLDESGRRRTRAQKATTSPRRRAHPLRPGSANQRERAKTSESEDTVTDVTPLSTPDVSPRQSLDLILPPRLSVTVSEKQQQDVAVEVPATEVDAGRRRRTSSTDGEERSGMDSVLVLSSPSSASISSCSSRRQKNFTFTDDEVRRIERENQRLLRELSRSSARCRGSAHISTARRSTPPTARYYHSALNRQREQQRIQRENLAFLKRLESVKPTPGMTRKEQLTDYQRQCGYLGIPAPVSRPSTGRGSRPSSTNSPHRSRPETAKPSRTTAPRPAWS